MPDLSKFSAVAEEVARGEGASKVIKRINKDCALVIAKFPEDSYIIAVRQGGMTSTVVAKLVPSTRVAEVPWECRYLDYVPHGYYIISEDQESFKNKLVSKLRSLRGPARAGRT